MTAARSMGIAYSEHALREDIPAPPAVVRDFYVDLRNIIAVHPLVVSVTAAHTDTATPGDERTYRVRDRIPIGPLTLPVTYSATVRVAEDGVVHTTAHQFPAIRLTGIVTFDPTDAGTRLTERLTIGAPWPLAALTSRRAVAAHATMLAGIRMRFIAE